MAFKDVGNDSLGEPGDAFDEFNLSLEEKRDSLDYLMMMTDAVINRNVDENSRRRKLMFKQRDFYSGLRDKKEFAYLEDNYGVGSPSAIKFTPLIRNRIDVLVGLLSATEFDYKVTVTDNKSLFLAEQEQSVELLSSLYAGLGKSVKPKKEGEEPTAIDRLIEQAKTETNRKWRNKFLESAVNLIEDYRDCPVANLAMLRSLLFMDLTVVGEAVYRVYSTEKGRKPKPEALIPENAYYTKRRDQMMMNEAMEFVYIRYMSRRDILQKYGHLMGDEEREELMQCSTVKFSETWASNMTVAEYNQQGERDVELAKSSPDRYGIGDDSEVIKVYETEWIGLSEYEIDPNDVREGRVVVGPEKIRKTRIKEHLFRSVRVDDSIYLDMGLVEDAVRHDTDPDKVYLSFNGVRHSDRGGSTYSILWKCKDIQDTHDIMVFHRDNLLANSGVRGLTLEYSAIPEFYGVNEMERALKASKMLKNGLNLVDTTQEGSAAVSGATHGTFDMTVNGESLSAINQTILDLDGEATKVTGVTPAMIGEIQQREAVSNVRVGMNNSSLVLKHLYDEHDVLMKYLLTDLINLSKTTLDDNYRGTYNEGKVIFSIIPKYFSFTNYRIKVVNSSAEKAKLEEAKAIVSAAMNTGAVPVEVGLRIVMMDNPSEIIEYAAEIAEKHGDLSKALEEKNKEMEELTKVVEKAKKEIERLNKVQSDIKQAELQLQKEKHQKDLELKEKDLDSRTDYNDRVLELKDRSLDLEEKQMYMSDNAQQRLVRKDIV